MPTYSINMNSGDQSQGWNNAADALGKALTPDYKGMADGRLRNAQTESAFASGRASDARARYSGAQADTEEFGLEKLQEMYVTLGQEGLTDDERLEVIGEHIGLTNTNGGQFGAWARGMGGVTGADDERMNQLQLGSGMNTAATLDGFKADQSRQSSEFIMGEAGKATRAQTAIDQEITPVTNEDGTAGFARGIEALDGGKPLLSETQQKALDLQNADPNAPAFAGYEGTAIAVQDRNILMQLNDKMRNGTATQAEQLAYASAYHRSYQEEKGFRTGADGETYEYTRQPEVPAGQYVPGSAPPAPASQQGVSSVVLPQQGVGQPLQSTPNQFVPITPETAASAVAGAPGPAAGALTGAGDGTTMTPIDTGIKPPKSLTESQAKYGQYAKRIQSGMFGMFAQMGYDPVSGELSPEGFRPGLWDKGVDAIMPGMLAPYAKTDAGQKYDTFVAQTLNPLMRADSGAAIPDTEYPRYEAQYVPQPGESDEVVKAKLDHLALTQAAFAEISTPGTPMAAAYAEARGTGNSFAQQELMRTVRNRMADELGIAISEISYAPDGTPTNVGIRQPQGGVTQPQGGQPGVGATDSFGPDGQPMALPGQVGSTLDIPGGPVTLLSKGGGN